MDQSKMFPNNVVLGDIVLVTGGPDMEEPLAFSTKAQAVIKKSRNLFVPIRITTFGSFKNTIYGELGTQTGGAFLQVLIPYSPQVIDWYGGRPWLVGYQDKNTSFKPWDTVALLSKEQLFKRGGFGGRSGESAAPSFQSVGFISEEEILVRNLNKTSFSEVLSSPDKKSPRAVYTERLPILIDSSFVAVNITAKTRNYAANLDFTLSQPNGESYPVEFSRTGAVYSARVEVADGPVGNWILTCVSNTPDIELEVLLTGEAPSIQEAFIANVEVIDAPIGVFNSAENGGLATIMATVRRGDAYLTDATVALNITNPQGGGISGLELKDDGTAYDAIAHDGIYTVKYKMDIPGRYQIQSTIRNTGGKARETRLLQYRGESFDLEGPSPFLGERIAGDFKRIANAEIVTIHDPASAYPDTGEQQRPLPYFYLEMGNLNGPTTILPGIETEYSLDITPTAMKNNLAKYISWSFSDKTGVRIIPDPGGRPDVVRVLVDENKNLIWESLVVRYTVPSALIDMMEPVAKLTYLTTGAPAFGGPGFWSAKPLVVFAGEDVRFDGFLWLPDGYSRKATWSKPGDTGQVAELIAQDAQGCTVKTLKPGSFRLQLTSDLYPDKFKSSFEVKVIPREATDPGLKPDPEDGAKPSPGPGDPGGDDDVDTEPGDGEGGGGTNPTNPGRPGGETEIPDPKDPISLPPGVSRITVNGVELNTGTVKLDELKPVLLAFEFDSPVARHSLSAFLVSQTSRSENTPSDVLESVISKTVLSEDGLSLTAKFEPKMVGQYRLYYRFEKKDGMETTGDFLLTVERSATEPTEPEKSGGGGCNAGVGMIVLGALGGVFILWKGASVIGKRLFCVALGTFFLLCGFAPLSAGAATYLVKNAGDDVENPPLESLRSVLNTIKLLDVGDDIIQFDPKIDEIELKGTLDVLGLRDTKPFKVKLDARTGRKGKYLTLTLAEGGYRHMLATSGFSADGIVFKGFGKGDIRNVQESPNGGVIYSGVGTTFENCSFIDNVGKASALYLTHMDALLSEGDIIIENCLFKGNFSEDGPGAIDVPLAIQSPMVGDVVLQDSFLGYNKAAEYGGAINCSEFGPSAHNTVIGNRIGIDKIKRVLSPSRTPSNLMLRRSVKCEEIFPFSTPMTLVKVVIKKCIFINNETKESGGALSCVNLRLLNSTIFGNIAGKGAPAINTAFEESRSMLFATLFAGNDVEDGSYISQAPILDERGNLFADDVADTVISQIFESYPPTAEDRGGYTPVVPIRYAGLAEGRVSSDVLADPMLTGYLSEFEKDVRGVPRDYAKGASVGAYEFGTVALLPGNIQNSTTIAFKPNGTGSIKIKLVETVNASGLSVTNYLAGIPVNFDLKSGVGLENLPKTVDTADNGRAFVTVDTLSAGDSTVRVSLKDRPSLFLDLLVRLGDYGDGGETPVEDDLYVVTLDPSKTRANEENTHVATFSRTCASSTVSVRRKGQTELLESDLPVTITNSVYGTVGKKLCFPEKGSYMFDFKMTDAAGRTYNDTKEIKVAATGSLKVFRLSPPPYFEDKTLSLIAAFDKAPLGIDMTLTDEESNEYKPSMRWQNDRLDWEGIFTPHKTGYFKARLDYTDGSDGRNYSETATIDVAAYYGEDGDAIAKKDDGGCNLGMMSTAWVALGLIFLRRARN